MEWAKEELSKFAKIVMPEKGERVVIYKFSVPDGPRDLRIYTVDSLILEFCKHLAAVYPSHIQFFFSSFPLFRYSADFQSYWTKNFKQMYDGNSALRGFCPNGPCIFIVDNLNTKEVQMSLASGMMFKRDAILVILCLEDLQLVK